MDVPLGVVVAALVGLAASWWLTRAMTRVPVGGGLLGPSVCDGCGAPLPLGRQLPLWSWARSRGRAACCAGPVDTANPLVEVAAALLFGATYLVAGLSWILPALWYLAALAVVATVIDVRLHRLPDALTLPAYPAVAGLLVLALLGPGDLSDLGRAALGGLALFGFYLSLAVANPSGMGGGDVKLSGALGMLLGWFGWEHLVVGGLAAFFIAAAASLGLLLAGRAGRKSRVPFGPFMFLGAYVGLLGGPALAAWYLG